ncbi:hypothetical protein A5658_25930 [Mycobacterium sp. 1245111.1]|nr:hypothetical protein A5658_25930 [Mycobacterium sp. 1245111.1]
MFWAVAGQGRGAGIPGIEVGPGIGDMEGIGAIVGIGALFIGIFGSSIIFFMSASMDLQQS